MEETKFTFCRICEQLCGLKITVKDNKVIKVEPDKENIATKGHICIKGMKQHLIYNSPDRLKYPLKRTETGFERITWEQALSEIGSKIKELKGIDPDSIAMYIGTAAGFGVLHPIFAQGFMTGVGSKSMYGPHTQDCASKFTGSQRIYGFPFTQPFPDIENIKTLIIVGANPAMSKFSFLQLPHPLKQLKKITARGGKVVFIDPRKTESAQSAGEHIFIRPDTDVFFYMSFLNELIKQNGVDKEKVQNYMDGYERLAEFVGPWTPEKTEKVTGIKSDILKSLVSDYIISGASALYCSTGVNMGTNGALAFWIQEAINAVSGNLDRKGGTLVSKGVFDFPKFGKRSGTLLRKDKSRIGGFNSVSDCFPGGILADEILTPGKGQIKAFFCSGGNPLITMPNSSHLKEAFKQLELLVVLDIFLNETASLAHYVLPATTPFERPDLPFIFPLMLGLQLNPYMQATETVIESEPEQLEEPVIYTNLAKAAGLSIFNSGIVQKLFENGFPVNKKSKRIFALNGRRILTLILFFSGNGTFRRMLKNIHGKLLKGHIPGSFLGKRVYTDNGRVQLAPPLFISTSIELEKDFNREIANSGKIKLITKRSITTHNSWTHNIEEFAKMENYTNYLYMNPKDAEVLGISEFDLADISTETAALRLPVKFLDTLMTGAAALPHGWGHQHARGLSVASMTKGVNVNILAADGVDNIDPVSGMSHLTGIYVDIRKAAGNQEHTWTGLKEKILVKEKVLKK